MIVFLMVIAFIGMTHLNLKQFKNIIKQQDYIGVAVSNTTVIGFYIIHKNNAGRGSHIANALYAVDKQYRGKGI